jgi:hypothetical protein
MTLLSGRILPHDVRRLATAMDRWERILAVLITIGHPAMIS